MCKSVTFETYKRWPLACKCYEISISELPDPGALDLCKQAFGQDLSRLERMCHRFYGRTGISRSDGQGQQSVNQSIAEVADDCRPLYTGVISRVSTAEAAHDMMDRTSEQADLDFSDRWSISITITIRIVFW